MVNTMLPDAMHAKSSGDLLSSLRHERRTSVARSGLEEIIARGSASWGVQPLDGPRRRRGSGSGGASGCRRHDLHRVDGRKSPNGCRDLCAQRQDADRDGVRSRSLCSMTPIRMKRRIWRFRGPFTRPGRGVPPRRNSSLPAAFTTLLSSRWSRKWPSFACIMPENPELIQIHRKKTHEQNMNIMRGAAGAGFYCLVVMANSHRRKPCRLASRSRTPTTWRKRLGNWP